MLPPLRYPSVIKAATTQLARAKRSSNDDSDRGVARNVMNLSISLDAHTCSIMVFIASRKHERVVSDRVFLPLNRDKCDSFSEVIKWWSWLKQQAIAETCTIRCECSWFMPVSRTRLCWSKLRCIGMSGSYYGTLKIRWYSTRRAKAGQSCVEVYIRA